ncbi:rhamnulokinase [Paenibacillus daejeonensis]|uniref:rhamnulokinase n=1 Tax=Paenibacillus daejeonensis TaxID=135193 RepID=UPI0003654E8B|nr:rhamnulokinase [Paenibacillus daejeonensis]
MSVLAFDLGASSGRALLGTLENGKLTVREVHRFANDPVHTGKHLHWDILRLYHEMKQGIIKARQQGLAFRSIAIDSWAVDYGLLDKNGELLGNPYHYRDHQTDGVMAQVFEQIPERELFGRNGIQFLQFNTIFQLYALKERQAVALQQADQLLMIPDLLRYFLTGERKSEFSNASTTQLYHPLEQDWDRELIERLGLPAHLFAPVVLPGTVVGQLRPELAAELDVPACPVIAVAEHDTGSAVAAVPAGEGPFAYLSCGTWSLMGTEVDAPVLTERARELNFTNEGGVGGTFRLLKNIMGLWIIQECKRIWEQEGQDVSFAGLAQLARQESACISFIDPDHESFFNPSHMPSAIQAYCRTTNQTVPETPGQITRCIMDSLALKYRYILGLTAELSGVEFAGLHMVGGGIQNELLCQLTAEAIGKPVWAGPVEASAIGNILVQYMALGEIQSIRDARSIVRDSFPAALYEPQEPEVWDKAYAEFVQVTGLQ